MTLKSDEATGLLNAASKFISQVGFPVVATLLMFYIVYCSQEKMTNAMQEQTKTMLEMNITMRAFQTKVEAEHQKFQNDLTEIKYRDLRKIQ